MKPCGPVWDQMTQKEKVDSLHKTQEQIRQSINRLYRLAYPELKEKVITETTKTNKNSTMWEHLH